MATAVVDTVAAPWSAFAIGAMVPAAEVPACVDSGATGVLAGLAFKEAKGGSEGATTSTPSAILRAAEPIEVDATSCASWSARFGATRASSAFGAAPEAAASSRLGAASVAACSCPLRIAAAARGDGGASFSASGADTESAACAPTLGLEPRAERARARREWYCGSEASRARASRVALAAATGVAAAVVVSAAATAGVAAAGVALVAPSEDCNGGCGVGGGGGAWVGGSRSASKFSTSSNGGGASAGDATTAAVGANTEGAGGDSRGAIFSCGIGAGTASDFVFFEGVGTPLAATGVGIIIGVTDADEAGVCPSCVTGVSAEVAAGVAGAEGAAGMLCVVVTGVGNGSSKGVKCASKSAWKRSSAVDPWTVPGSALAGGGGGGGGCDGGGGSSASSASSGRGS